MPSKEKYKLGILLTSQVPNALEVTKWVPERRFEREFLGLRDDVDGSYSWKKTLSFVVCKDGLKNLTKCIEEKQVEERRPDLLAFLDGQPIAIEIAYTHFCDDAKFNWLRARNLTALEIDVGMPTDIEMPEIRSQLEERLFSSSPFSTWLVHSGDAYAHTQIEIGHNNLLAANAEIDAAFLKAVERKRAEKKRKDEFKQLIKDIDFWERKINRDLTLRIAYSQIRCTLKWHGHSKTLPDTLLNALSSMAKKHGGIFNSKYSTWEFKTSEGKAQALYTKLTGQAEDVLNVKVQPSEQLIISTEESQSLPAPWLNGITLPNFQNPADEDSFKERAAILQYANNISQAEAEWIAIREYFQKRFK